MSTDQTYNIPVENTNSNLTYSMYTPYSQSSTYFTYSLYVYLYQIRCPKRACKKMNWLELNKTTPCTGCGSKLRAVKEEDLPDFEVPVG